MSLNELYIKIKKDIEAQQFQERIVGFDEAEFWEENDEQEKDLSDLQYTD